MAKIERFEEIKAWQLAKDLVTTVYRSSENGRFAKDYSLRDQIRRAAVSVMSNIAEGFERGLDKFTVLRGKAEDVSKSLSGFITYLYGESST